MSTIDELMAGKKPGEIKIRRAEWGLAQRTWFKPMYKINNCWIGPSSGSECDRFFNDCDDWEIYREPKKKVVRWLWANGMGEITSQLYDENERERAEFTLGFTIKLEWSRSEFDG